MTPAIFLDRDGVICKERNLFYSGTPLLNPLDFEWEFGSDKALDILSKLDFHLIITSNQSIIGKGLLSEEKFHEINSPIYKILNKEKRNYGVYFCPHKSEDNCFCRKPSLGMINLASRDFDIDLANSYVVGDKTSDIKLGENAKCKTVLVKTGYNGRDCIYPVEPDFIFTNLFEFSKYLENKK